MNMFYVGKGHDSERECAYISILVVWKGCILCTYSPSLFLQRKLTYLLTLSYCKCISLLNALKFPVHIRIPIFIMRAFLPEMGEAVIRLLMKRLSVFFSRDFPPKICSICKIYHRTDFETFCSF